MNFWEAQRRARAYTWLYLIIFIVLAVLIAIGIEFAVYYLYLNGFIPYIPYLGIVFLGTTFFIATIYYLIYRSSGGRFVAESLGGYAVSADTRDFKEKQLLNIVDEIAIASSLPTPAVYVIDAVQINAFAAGTQPNNAAITVTRGALELLNRDELQGVVAHEFGHIANGDARINMRLAAMIMGFVFLLYIGIRLLEGSMLTRGRRNGGGGGNPIAWIALIIVLSGIITWFAGAILRSTISRQREYLADASSVQYTRNPKGLASALRKTAASAEANDMPKSGMAYSHLYFNNESFWSKIFATHPPIEKRIAALERT